MDIGGRVHWKSTSARNATHPSPIPWNPGWGIGCKPPFRLSIMGGAFTEMTWTNTHLDDIYCILCTHLSCSDHCCFCCRGLLWDRGIQVVKLEGGCSGGCACVGPSPPVQVIHQFFSSEHSAIALHPVPTKCASSLESSLTQWGLVVRSWYPTIFHWLFCIQHQILWCMLKVVFECEWRASYFSSLRAKLIFSTSMNRYKMFCVQTSTLPPSENECKFIRVIL